MEKNLIQVTRLEIQKYFDETKLIIDTEETHFSPNKKYFFKSNYYTYSNDSHSWIVTKIQIFQTDNQQQLFEFIRNDDSLFYCWLIIEQKTYLFLSEDIEGKSFFDCTECKFHSYSFENDKFIFCEYFPSPNGKRLAIIGCHWACPYEIIVFDTSELPQYPLRELYRQNTFQEKIEWLDNTTLKISDDENAKLLAFG